MRAIAAVIHLDRSPVAADDLQRIMCAMNTCDCDQLNTAIRGGAAMGQMLRLFFREDHFENQPLRTEDGKVFLVTDAVLDNRREIADELGWPAPDIQNTADSAFVLAAYQKWGADCTKHLEGRFAFIAWHEEARRLFCAVDHLGFRPLYFWRKGTKIAIATTLRGLFALPGIPRRLNEEVFATHVAGLEQPDISATFYEGIQCVPGGHHLVVDECRTELVRHWNPNPETTLQLNSDAEYVEAFKSELQRAVASSFERAPRETGLLVSGGLDSSAICAVAGKILADKGRCLHAIHLVPDEISIAGRLRQHDESEYAKALSRHAPHIQFHFLRSQAKPFSPGYWDAIFDDNFVPFRGIPAINESLRDTLDRSDISTLLHGSGGNFLISIEALASGYLTHLAASGKVSAWLREARGRRRIYGDPMLSIIRKTILGPIKRRLSVPPEIEELSPIRLLRPGFREQLRIDKRRQEQTYSAARPPRDFRKTLCARLTTLVAVDSTAAPSALSRGATQTVSSGPMLNRRFNEFCLSLPFTQQIRDGIDRRLLREAMRGLLPENIRLRTTRGLPQPNFRNLLKQSYSTLQLESERIESSTEVRRILDTDWIRQLGRLGAHAPERAYRTWIDGMVFRRFLDWNLTRTSS